MKSGPTASTGSVRYRLCLLYKSSLVYETGFAFIGSGAPCWRRWTAGCWRSVQCDAPSHCCLWRSRRSQSQYCRCFGAPDSPSDQGIRSCWPVISSNRQTHPRARCRLSVSYTHLDVYKRQGLPTSTISWERVREHFRYRMGGAFDAASEFVFASPMVPRQGEFADYARPSFLPGLSLLACALDLMHRIHHDFVYESQSTEINTRCV